MNEIGNLLKKLRGIKSLRMIAELTNNQISHNQLSLLEKGEVYPKEKHLEILSKIYNYPYEKLLKTAGYPNKIEKIFKEFEELSEEEKRNFLNRINQL
jgi:transcriptional regulator with XRE-family HTH domain